MPTRSGLQTLAPEAPKDVVARRDNVVPFQRVAPPSVRLSMADRIAALRWSQHVAQHGYSRIVFDTAGTDCDQDHGDFILIYPRDAIWARWGIGCGPEGLMLWNTASGTTIGVFQTMTDTLAALPVC